MRMSGKPVRKCHACLLNLGKRCWRYPNPREQWRHGKSCPGFENPVVYQEFRQWQKEPHVKTRKELRRALFRAGRHVRYRLVRQRRR